MKNMNKKIRAAVIPIMIAASALVALKPANANFLHDLEVGAGSGVGTGYVLRNGRVVNNAIGGAATGAVVHATDNGHHRNVAQDAAVGAATNTAVGAILGNGHAGRNAISGAADGALVNIFKK